MSNKIELVRFKAEDGVRIDGYMNKGDSKTDKILIQIHGMSSNCFKDREKVISEKMQKIHIDSLDFNTRGSDIVRYVKYDDGRVVLGGTAFEDVEESYYDILGAIKYAISLGYTQVFLQGHSLGATKVVYTYNKMKKEKNEYLKFIKGIILLSLVDIPEMIRDNCSIKTLKYAEEKEQKNEVLDLMPEGSFIHPISVKTFLRYAKYNENIDFARYSNEDDEFEVLNNIDVPLFMRWGEDDILRKSAKNQVGFMRVKLRNPEHNIWYIEGANHSYKGKEDVLEEENKGFIERFIKV